MKFVIFSGGDFVLGALAKKAIREADRIIAADSGADTALRLGITPLAVIGDMDSISSKAKRLLEKRVLQSVPTTLLSPPKGHTGPFNDSEKDQTDTELAIKYAVTNGATQITILGGVVGNRLDHIIANLLLAIRVDVPIYFTEKNQTSWIANGPTTQSIHGSKGDILSLIPIAGDVTGITSTYLYYPLVQDTLVFGAPRGVSNVLLAKRATVHFQKGILLFVHTSLE